MIRVVHVIRSLNEGGAEGMLCRLVERMDRSAFAPEVVTLCAQHPLADRLRAARVPLRSLHLLPGGLPGPRAVMRLARWLGEWGPCVVQGWMYHADLLAGVAGLLAGGIPVAWGIRQSVIGPERPNSVLRWTRKACTLLSPYLPGRIVCGSEAAREVHAALGYATRRMVVIPNGFDLEQFRPDPAARRAVRTELGLSPTALLVGLINRFDPYKDHRTFVAAAGLVARDRPDVRFLLCGDGVNEDNRVLAGWIDQHGLRDRVHLLGHRRDVARLNAALDVATLSSVSEGFPNVVGEAMASGVPCVVTDVGDAARIVADTGRVVPRSDPAALARALGEVLALPSDQRLRLGRAARRRVEENYELSAIVRRYEALYRELAGGAGEAADRAAVTGRWRSSASG